MSARIVRACDLGVSVMVAHAEGNLWTSVYLGPLIEVVGHTLNVVVIRGIGSESHHLPSTEVFITNNGGLLMKKKTLRPASIANTEQVDS